MEASVWWKFCRDRVQTDSTRGTNNPLGNGLPEVVRAYRSPVLRRQCAVRDVH